MNLPVFKHDEFTHILNQYDVAYGFFGRKGGVSKTPFDSLNTGYGSGDDISAVKENRKRVAAQLSSSQTDPIAVYQAHTSDVRLITSSTGLQHTRNPDCPADALVTRTADRPLSVLTADCTPLLFFAETSGKRLIAAVHAGWRGALAGVIENTLGTLYDEGADPASIYVCIGPNIKQPSYEVGEELYDSFTAKNEKWGAYFLQNEAGRYQFDLTSVCVDILHQSGVKHIFDIGIDTYQRQDDFFSHRRSQHMGEKQFGRQISAINIF